ncbi:MAG: hypothetical protein V3R36_00600 [Dehalococcoidales bacterium]
MPDKTVARKLMIKDNYSVRFINEPPDYRITLGQLQDTVTVLTEPSEPVNLIQIFVISRRELEAQLEDLKPALKPGGLLWGTYPKGTSRNKADINRDTINRYARSIGLQGVAMISVDDTWSALRLKPV